MITVATLRLRLVPMMTLIAASLLAVYVALMVATILYAALETQLAQNVQSKRMDIAKLEGKYYEKVAELDSTNPVALGYVQPSTVHYVTASSLPNLTFAN